MITKKRTNHINKNQKDVTLQCHNTKRYKYIYLQHKKTHYIEI